MKMTPLLIICIVLVFALGCGMANAAIMPETNTVNTPFPNVTESPAEYVVAADVLNVRKRPSIYAPVVDWLSQGEVITVLGEHTDTDGIVWYNIGHDEWVSACCVVGR